MQYYSTENIWMHLHTVTTTICMISDAHRIGAWVSCGNGFKIKFEIACNVFQSTENR